MDNAKNASETVSLWNCVSIPCAETYMISIAKYMASKGFQQDEIAKRLFTKSDEQRNSIEALMGITINGPECPTPECDALINVCVQTWLAKKKRCNLPIPKSS